MLASGGGLGVLETLRAPGYVRPSSLIEEAVLAPWHLNVDGGALCPQGRRWLVSRSDGAPGIARLAKPHRLLAGITIDTVAERSRDMTVRALAGYEVWDLASGEKVRLSVPEGRTVSGGVWSPDGTQIAYWGLTDTENELYVADAGTGRSRRVLSGALLTQVTSIDWLHDSRRVVVVLKPSERMRLLGGPVPEGPMVRNSSGRARSLRTWASLLQSREDEDFLERSLTGQVAVVDVTNSRTTLVGKPAMVEAIDPAPDGSGFLVTVMERPFSPLVPSSQFPERRVLWSESGEEKAVISQRSLPVPGQAAPRADEGAMRNVGWLPDGSGLGYLQLEPEKKEAAPPTPAPGGGGAGLEVDDFEQGRGGAPTQDAPASRAPTRADRVMKWSAPWREEDKTVVWTSETRLSGIEYGPDPGMLFVAQTQGNRTVTSLVRPGTEAKPVVVLSRAQNEDWYANPGTLVTTRGPVTGRVVRMDPERKAVYLQGTTFSRKPFEEAPRPFIDRLTLADGKKERVFESQGDVHESPTLMDDAATRFLVTRQSPTTVPQVFWKEGERERQITKNRDFLPDLSQARQTRLVVTRADGIRFSATMTVPAGATSFSKLPAFFWFYPTEYENQQRIDESERTFNKNAFRRIRSGSTAILLRAGYVVVEPQHPLVGPASSVNDTFAHQTRMNWQATVDAVAETGYVDRRRLALGGHSYGAFGTANALIHTALFRAGIAGAGNYNRSLTPFGFQSEPRQLWQAREMYEDVSAIWHAEKMTGAILLYHGMQDQNMGTAPLNSERLFQALEALGKNAALYMYPYEDHGQIALETRLDMWARWVAWLDRWVKVPEKYEEGKKEPSTPPLMLF